MSDVKPVRASRRRVWGILLALALTLVGMRLALILFAFEDLFTPGYELFPMGVLGDQILQGLPSISVFEFHDTHSGGQILSAVLSAASFAVFGKSYLALKLVPVLFAVGTLAAVYLFVERRFGLPAAVFSGAMLVFGPASYVDYSTANFGNHSEVLFFVALSLYPLYALLVDGRRDLRTYLLFGLTTGLAVWYALSSLLLLVLYAALWFAVDGRFLLRRTMWPWLVGLILGTLPLTYVMMIHDAPQVTWLEAKFGGKGVDWAAAPGRFATFWGDLLPRSPCFYDLGPVKGIALDRILVCLWLAAMLFMLVRRRRSVAWFLRRLLPPYRGFETNAGVMIVVFFGYLLALACAYAFSNFKIGNWSGLEWGGFRYMLTLFLIFNLVMVTAFVELRRLGRRRLAGSLAALAVAVGAAGNVGHSFSTVPSIRQSLLLDGFHYEQMARVFMLPRYDDPGPVVELLEGLTPRRRQEVYQGLGFYKALMDIRDDDWNGTTDFAIAPILARHPVRYAPLVAWGVGKQVTYHSNVNKGTPRERAGWRAILEDGGPATAFLVQGTMLNYEVVPIAANVGKIDENFGAIGALPPGLRPFGLQGQGLFVGSLLWRGIREEVAGARAAIDRVGKFGPEQQAAFFLGLGGAMLDYWDDPARHDALLAELVPTEHLPVAYQGLGWTSNMALQLGPEALERLDPALDDTLRDAVRAGLGWRESLAQRFAPPKPTGAGR